MNGNKSKIFILCMLCVICMSFAGCVDKGYLKNIDNTESGSAAEQFTEDRFADFEGFCASSGSGIYVKATNEQGNCYNIYYYDYNKNISTVWCNKLQCSHSSEECSSYISFDSKYDSIYFHDGKLYKIKEDDAGVYLESFDADGSGQNRLTNMMPEDEKVLRFMPQKFYKGYFYYVILNEQKNLIVYRIGLSDNASADRLFEMEGESDKDASLAKFCVNDKYIYASTSVRMESGEYKATRYLFDLAERKYSIIYEDRGGKVIFNDKMYIMESAGVLTEFDGSGNEKNIELKDLPEDPDKYEIYCNEKYIVFDNYFTARRENTHRKIYVYEINTGILKEYNLSPIEEKVKKEAGTVVVFGTDPDSFNNMVFALPIGIDGSGYYIANPGGGTSEFIRFRLDSSLWDELGEYSTIEMEE